jgi:hypothetical protein
MTEAKFKTFYYPEQKNREAHRMCAAGQRRAAAEAWNWIVPGGDIGKKDTERRGLRTVGRLDHGADVNKHDVISFVVVDLLTAGRIEEYVDRDGNYTLETSDGRRLPRNILEDAAKGKRIF